MGGEHGDLVEDVDATLLGLPAGRGNADDDVSQDLAREAAEIAFAHGEGEHVRRSILLPIDFVQLMNSIIVG